MSIKINGVKLEVAHNNNGAVIGWRISAGDDVVIVPAESPSLVAASEFQSEGQVDYFEIYSGRPEA